MPRVLEAKLGGWCHPHAVAFPVTGLGHWGPAGTPQHRTCTVGFAAWHQPDLSVAALAELRHIPSFCIQFLLRQLPMVLLQQQARGRCPHEALHPGALLVTSCLLLALQS